MKHSGHTFQHPQRCLLQFHLDLPVG
jgi:hypothetical protein